jgi:WD40 repeat protein
MREIGPGGDNLAIITLRHGVPERTDQLPTTAAGTGLLRRVSASTVHRRLATLGVDDSVAVWDLGQDISERPSRLAVLAPSDFDGLKPVRIALSPDGALLLCAFKEPNSNQLSNQLLAVAPDAGSQVRTSWIKNTGLKGVREIAFSSDGTRFAAGGEAPEPRAGAGVDRVQLWDVRGGQLEKHDTQAMDVTRLAKKVHDITFAADAAGHPLVVSGGEYGQIDLWDARTGKALPTLRADSRPVLQIAFQPEASLLAAADDHGVVRLWSTVQWQPVQLTPRSDPAEIPGFLAFGPTGDWLAVGTDTLTVWDLNVASLRRKACAILRDPGQHGAEAADALPRVCREAR